MTIIIRAFVLLCQPLHAKLSLNGEEVLALLALYYVGLFFCHLANLYTGVRYSRGTRGLFSLALSSCVTCTIASCFFLSTTGFRPLFNLVTFGYALLYSAIVLVAQYAGLAIYRHTDVAGFGMMRSGASLALSCMAGAVLFEERVTVITVLRILCMLGAMLAVFLHNCREKSGRWTPLGWVLGAVLLVTGVGGTVISKYFAIDPRVTDSSSYFLLVNLICLFVSLTLVLVLQCGNVRGCLEELRTVKLKNYGYIAVNTVCSNLMSLLSVAILASGDLLLYSPLNSAISILTMELVAVFSEKERPMPIPVILSLVAAVLSFWG